MTKAICHIYGQLGQTGARMGEVLDYLARNRIPSDISFDLKSDAPILATVREWQERGNLVAPDVYPHVMDRSCTNANWWTYTTEDCVRLIRILQKRARAAGFPEINAVNTYTPGNTFVAACKQMGIEYLLGFCAPIVINDGHWQITHSGSPLSPYFAGDEDYRKPESPGSRKALLIASMELRNPITCRENWSEGPFCPLNLIMGDRTIEAGPTPIESIAMCEDFIRLSELTGVPRFFHINLQYFTSPKCFDLTYRLLDWLVVQREAGRLEFTGLQDYAKTLRRSGGLVPQATYWRGECMGQMVGGQPGNGNEALIVETIKGQWQFRRGANSPDRFFDYTKRWNFPAFDPKGGKPRSYGYEATARVVAVSNRPKQRTLTIEVDGPAFRKIAVWDALENLSAPFRVLSCSEGAEVEVVPHPGGTGGVILVRCEGMQKADGGPPSATHVARVGPARAVQVVRVAIEHSGTKPNNHSRRIRDLISVETTWISGRAVTRLAALVPYELKFSLRVAARGKVRFEFINGKDFGGRTITKAARIAVVLNGIFSASMARFRGMTADELVFDESELDAIQAHLRRDAMTLAGARKGISYLTSVSEKNYPAWIRKAAKRGADEDIKRVNRIVRKQFGPFCAAYHMAADLPFGSKGRVRSQFYDRQQRLGDEEIFPLFYDYGQSYGPGITGWNQFLRINLGVRGLTGKKKYRLVLQLFDPESRNTRVRITAYATNTLGETRASPEIMLKDPFLVAQGIPARYADEAFVVVPLSKACRSDEAVNIGIHSHSEYRLYDRLTEGFGFVFLSHAWLVAEEARQDIRRKPAETPRRKSGQAAGSTSLLETAVSAVNLRAMEYQ